MKTPISETAFSHVFNDAYLSGSYRLEGQSFRDAVAPLKAFLSEASLPDWQSIDHDRINWLIDACDTLIEQETNIRSGASSDESGLKLIAQNWYTLIMAAQSKPSYQATLLPGGYINRTKPSHAAAYLFQFTPEGHLRFNVLNGGAGIQYHPHLETEDQLLYNPALTKEIKADQLANEADFLNLLTSLIQLQKVSRKERDEDDLYKKALSKLLFLKAKPVPPTAEDFPGYIARILSGTCTEAVIELLLRPCFANVDDYERFLLSFKMFVFEAYIQQIIQASTPLPQNQRPPIKKAYRHLLGQLNQYRQDGHTYLLTHTTLVEYEKKLTGLMAELNKSAPGKNKVLSKQQKQKERPLYWFNIKYNQPFLSHYRAPADGFEDKTLASFVGSPEEIYPELTPENLFDRMRVLLKACQKNAIRQAPRIYNQLEHFFLSLPLPEHYNHALLPFYHQCDIESQWERFFEVIEILQTWLFKLGAELAGQVVLPRLYTLKASTFFICLHLLHNHNKLPGKKLAHTFAYILSSLTQCNQRNPYVTHREPELDRRLTIIKKMAKPYLHQGMETNLIQGMDQIVANQVIDNEWLKGQMDAYLKTCPARMREALGKTGAKHIFWYQQNGNRLWHSQPDKLGPIRKHLHAFHVIEKAIGCGLDYLWGNVSSGYSVKQKGKVYYDTSTNKIRLTSFSNFLANQFFVSDALKSSQFLPQDQSIANTLAYFNNQRTIRHNVPSGAPTSSEVQIKALPIYENKEKTIEQTDLQERHFYHLRHVPECQIVLTLEYFIKHPDKLADPDVQAYCLANLFEPGLLLDILSDEQQTKQFWLLFNQFTHEGLVYGHTPDQFSEHHFFYALSATLVHHYSFRYEPTTYRDCVIKFIEKINHCLHVAQSQAVFAGLHACRFLLFNDLGQRKENAEALCITDVYISMMFANTVALPKQLQSASNRFLLQQAQRQWIQNKLFDEKSIDLNILTHALLEKHLLPPRDTWVHSQFARGHFEVNDAKGNVFALHLPSGCLHLNRKRQVAPPDFIINHPLAPRFNISASSPCYAIEHFYYFFHQGRKVKWRRHDSRLTIKQRFTLEDGKKAWFTLKAPSENHRRYFLLDRTHKFSTVNLPMAFFDRNLCFWLADDGDNIMMTNQHNELIYSLNTHSNPDYWQIHRIHDGAQILELDDNLTDLFCLIEAKQYLLFSENDAGDIQCQLPRYQLTFTKKHKDAHYHLNWQEQTYRIDKRQRLAQRGMPVLTVGDGSICIIPVTRFSATERRRSDNEYYQFQADLDNVITDDVLKNYQHHDVVPFFYDESPTSHTNTRSALILTMEAALPRAETPAQALYLAYLFLGSHQFKIALTYLSKCEHQLGGLTGHWQELQFIQWICEALPYQPIKHTGKFAAKLSTPPVVACQLKALALWTALPNAKRQLTIPHYQNTCSPEVLIQQYNRFKLNQFFQHGLRNSLFSLYRRYQTMRKNMAVKYTLTEPESLSLLTFYHQQHVNDKLADKPIGSLGYEWLSLKLKSVKQSLKKLQQKLSARQILLPFEQNRLFEMDRFMHKYPGVYGNETKLTRINVPLTTNFGDQLNDFTAAERDFNETFIKSKAVINDNKMQLQMSKAIAKLGAGLSLSEFQACFGVYLCIAIYSANEPHRTRLKRFCKARLRLHALDPHDSEAGDFGYLCAIIFAALNQQTIIANADIHHLDDFFSLLEPRGKSNQVVSHEPVLRLDSFDDTNTLQHKTNDIYEALPEPFEKTPAQIEPAQQKFINQLTLFNDSWPEKWALLQQQWQTLSPQFSTPASPGKDSESQAGEQKYHTSKARIALAQKAFASHAPIKEIVTHTKSQITEFNAAQESCLTGILKLANAGPDCPQENKRWQIKLASGKQRRLKINDLIALYLENNVHHYQRATQLEKKKINQLHGKTAEFLTRGILIQQLNRILAQCQHRFAERTLAASKLVRLCQTLFANNVCSALTNPAMTVFQYHEKILLRPMQFAGMNQFLSPDNGDAGEKGHTDKSNEMVARLMMGSGKSKVFLPLLAFLRADSHNLVMIEVPRALLKTNFVDLKNTSFQLFGQKAMLFDFSRDHDCRPEALEEIYQRLLSIRADKGYVVTTIEANQSLTLKLKELLNDKPEEETALSIWRQQIEYLQAIYLFRKDHGYLVIDEIDGALNIKNRLNYSIDSVRKLADFIWKANLSLYQFFDSVPVKETLTFANLIARHPAFVSENQYKKACEQLSYQLVHHADSPLLAMFAHNGILLNARQKAALVTYLLNESRTMPDMVKTLNWDLQEILAIYKHQCSELLSTTLRKHVNVDYGPSFADHQSEALKAIAVPYITNNEPKENSQFGNVIETVNYTIQSLLINGLTKPLLQDFCQTLLQQAFTQMQALSVQDINQSPAGQMFTQLTGGKLLTEADFDDETYMNRLHHDFADDPDLIFAILTSQILSNLTTTPQILTANAIEHIDDFRQVQGFSGTMNNVSTFHQRLQYNDSLAQGIDEFIMQCLHEKETPVRQVDFTNPDNLITELFAKCTHPESVTAIIDTAAAFNGIDNLRVAHALADYLVTGFGKQRIKFILFFDKQNQLSALSIHPDQSKRRIIKLPSSKKEIIAATLSCQAEERLTYYDQAHTIGTDIAQSDRAQGIILCDYDTSFSAFIQGSLRLRQLLDGEQRLDILVSAKLPSDLLSSMSLSRHFQENDRAVLRKDDFTAALVKMRNLIHHHLFNILLETHDIDKKAALFQTFKPFFVEVNNESFFERFGQLYQLEKVSVLLERYKTALLAQWQQVLVDAGMDREIDQKEAIAAQMQAIIKQTLERGLCAPSQYSHLQQSGTEVEMETQMELLTEQLNERINPDYTPTDYTRWRHISYLEPSLASQTLNDMINPHHDPDIPEFSKRIFVTRNFYQAYQGQKQYLNGFMRPVYAIYFFFNNRSKLSCCLLSPDELKELTQYLIKRSFHLCLPSPTWISTTQHRVLAGHKPFGIEAKPQYQTLIEQIRFFAGELSLIAQAETPYHWLSQQSSRKLAFFQHYLAPVREYDKIALAQLKSSLATLSDMLNFMMTDFTKDYRQFAWQKRFPDAEPSEINEVLTLATVFDDIKGLWWQSGDVCTTYAKKYALSPLVSGYLQQGWRQYVSQVRFRQLKWLAGCMENGLTDEISASLFSGLLTPNPDQIKETLENNFDSELPAVDINTQWYKTKLYRYLNHFSPRLNSDGFLECALALTAKMNADQIDIQLTKVPGMPVLAHLMLANHYLITQPGHARAFLAHVDDYMNDMNIKLLDWMIDPICKSFNHLQAEDIARIIQYFCEQPENIEAYVFNAMLEHPEVGLSTKAIIFKHTTQKQILLRLMSSPCFTRFDVSMVADKLAEEYDLELIWLRECHNDRIFNHRPLVDILIELAKDDQQIYQVLISKWTLQPMHYHRLLSDDYAGFFNQQTIQTLFHTCDHQNDPKLKSRLFDVVKQTVKATDFLGWLKIMSDKTGRSKSAPDKADWLEFFFSLDDADKIIHQWLPREDSEACNHIHKALSTLIKKELDDNLLWRFSQYPNLTEHFLLNILKQKNLNEAGLIAVLSRLLCCNPDIDSILQSNDLSPYQLVRLLEIKQNYTHAQLGSIDSLEYLNNMHIRRLLTNITNSTDYCYLIHLNRFNPERLEFILTWLSENGKLTGVLKEHFHHIQTLQQLALSLETLKKRVDEIAGEFSNKELTTIYQALDNIHQAQQQITTDDTGLISKHAWTDFVESTQAALNIIEQTSKPALWYQIHPIIRAILGILAAATIIPAVMTHYFAKAGYRQLFFGHSIRESAFSEADSVESLPQSLCNYIVS